MADKMFALALALYVIGVPISAGVVAKTNENPAAMVFVAPIWPAVALAYIGYRLAP